jgi:phosphoribosyl-ATP pyrophosphohydrolase/phosphoribosyl-AMP cyclohydrolase
MFDLNKLKFDENRLIPAVVQDFFSKKVLTVAYMNRESLEISIKEGRTCFYSRSRQTLWRKGETSGNTQQIVTIKADCDFDALVVEVIKAGPACHLGTDSCFSSTVFESGETPDFSIDMLYELLKDRKQNPKEGSYTSYLFDKGLDKILKKIGEESTEVIIGAKNSREEVIYEISDLCYHTLVLMVEAGITPEDILRELGSRKIVEKKVKQEKMQ